MHLDGKTYLDGNTFEPSTISCPTATSTALASAGPQEKQKATKPLDHALDPSKTRKGMLQQPAGRPHTHRHPRVPEFCQDATCLFYLIKGTHLPKHQEVSHQFKEATGSWIQAGHNPETHDHWLVGRSTFCKFVFQVCQAIIAELQEEYFQCPDSPEWKIVEEKFRTRWNVPHAVGAIDGKHITMKKPKKTGSDYYNYKGFCSLVLLVV